MGLDPPYPGGNAGLGDDLEETDIPGGVDVGAAAELGADPTHPDHPHPVAVLFAEERRRAALHRFLHRHLPGMDVIVLHDEAVDQLLHPVDLPGGHGRKVGEVEPEPIGATSEPACLT